MPVFTDTDRLNVAMRDGIMKVLREDILDKVNDVSDKIAPILEDVGATGTETDVTRGMNGTTVKLSTNVPVENAVEFVNRVDGTVKGEFRFGDWSDMRIN